MSTKTDIVFVNPPLSDEERYGVKFKAGGQTPPIGLAMLCAVCRKAGYNVALIDAPALRLNLSSTVDKILRCNPKCVGITAVTLSILNAAELAKLVKQRNADTVIVLGGPHITAVPSETLERLGPFFDIAVIGEGEATIIELLDALKNNKPLSMVNGIAYVDKKNPKQLKFTPPRDFINNLDSLPFPAWDMLPDLAKYYNPPAHTVKRFPATLLMTSRGCQGLCTFCDNKVFGRTLRSNSAEYVINMIRHLQRKYGIREIQFRDDNFLVFRRRTIELCNMLIEQNIDISWSCAGRVDPVTPGVLSLMRRAGCWQIWYGIESGSDKVLKAIRKNTNQERIAKAVIDTKRAGISPCGFFMIGMPTETEDDIRKTIDVILKLPLDEFHIAHLAPFPGSEIYRSASMYGYFDNDWKKMSGWRTIFVPRDLSEEQLVRYSNLAFRKFYFRPRIIINYLKRIRSLRHAEVYLSALIGLLLYTTMKER